MVHCYFTEERKRKKETAKSPPHAKTTDQKHLSKPAHHKKDITPTKEKTNINAEETQLKSQKHSQKSQAKFKVAEKSSTIDNESKEDDETERRKQISSEEERLWVRLDELEGQEEELDELAL